MEDEEEMSPTGSGIFNSKKCKKLKDKENLAFLEIN